MYKNPRIGMVGILDALLGFGRKSGGKRKKAATVRSRGAGEVVPRTETVRPDRTVAGGVVVVTGIVEDEEHDTAELAETARGLIEWHVGQDDVVHEVGPFRYAIRFATLTRSAADSKLSHIAAGLSGRLMTMRRGLASSLTVDYLAGEGAPIAADRDDEGFYQGLFDAVEERRQAIEDDGKPKESQIKRDAALLFEPTWNVARQATSINRCALDLSLRATALAEYRSMVGEDELTDTTAELDGMRLRKALVALHTMRAGRQPSLFIVPVTARTLMDAETWAHYGKVLSVMPAAYRSALIVEITEADGVMRGADLAAAVERLKAYADRVCLLAARNDPLLRALPTSGLWGVSIDLSSFRARDRNALGWLSGVSRLAHRLQMATLAYGVRSTGIAMAAITAEFDYLNGPAVHFTSSQPRPNSRLNPFPSLMGPSKSRRGAA